MEDFEDREMMGHEPMFGPEGPGGAFGQGGIYASGANFGPSTGTEKDFDKLDEKVKVDNIEKIPRYRFIKIHKAKKTYKFFKTAYNQYKFRIKINMQRLERINKKLEKYASYPDDAIGRDKLLKKKSDLEYELRDDQKDLSTTIKEKMTVYGKALGKKPMLEKDFIVYDTENKQQNNNAANSDDINENEEVTNNQIDDDIDTNINQTNNTSTDTVQRENENTNKQTQDSYNTIENSFNKPGNLNSDGTYRLSRDQIIDGKYYTNDNTVDNNNEINEAVKEASSKQEEINKKIAQEMATIYMNSVQKYGEDTVKKYWNSALSEILSSQQQENSELKQMLNGYFLDSDNTKTNEGGFKK